MLRKMGFLDQWIWKVMECVASISYSVVLNEEVGNSFLPSRGLCQGDPLSHYLFLICREGLSALLRMVAIRGHAPFVTHLFFANDSLIFGDAIVDVARVLKEKLEIYAQSSGQGMNFDKSRVFFSSNVNQNNREEVCRLLGVNSSINLEKYLDLPPTVGRNKKRVFKDIKEKIIKRVFSWSSRLLSVGGKEAILMYAMSCFLLPLSLYKELEAIMARF
ncbi:reverse transcriptase [Gossypium australe]|uniref:Reverse transcriptase n=1 Tax=Gossypium australe TaxID=47621 RepID=A0A5B6W5V8_9ROSI|nr:reverse transcriptase [Gossypium australe]